MSQHLLAATINQVSELNGVAMEAARARQQQLTKPLGALGILEDLSAQLAGMTGQLRPALSPRSVIVCAGDHGVTVEGVSAYPSEVTAQMVLNFLAGGAAVNVLARQFNSRVVVLDVGVAADLPTHPQLYAMKIRPGTNNMTQAAAMSRREAVAAVEAGIMVANAEIAAGARLLLTGDMGIGNTTATAAITAVLTGTPVSQVVGMGTGIGLPGWRRKCDAIERALALHLPDPHDPIDILSKVGGLEIGAIAGIALAGAAARIPVLIDGAIATAGAALAAKLCPASKAFMIIGHRSTEPCHTVLLNYLELSPILDLHLHLGEGSGALLALPMLDAAVTTLNEMATFGEANVAEKASGQGTV